VYFADIQLLSEMIHYTSKLESQCWKLPSIIGGEDSETIW